MKTNSSFSCKVFFCLTASERPEELCLGGFLRRHGDIHHVHSNSSVIVICCVSVPLPLETSFMFTWEAFFQPVIYDVPPV